MKHGCFGGRTKIIKPCKKQHDVAEGTKVHQPILESGSKATLLCKAVITLSN